MDTSNMQDMMTNTSSAAQQSVIQGTTPMNAYTATIYTQPMSNVTQNNQQQMLSMHQNRQQNESSAQAMLSDLNPFISGGLVMNQQTQQATDQMMSSPNDSDEKEAYKGKFNRGYLRTQLPWVFGPNINSSK